MKCTHADPFLPSALTNKEFSSSTFGFNRIRQGISNSSGVGFVLGNA
jgi:hypothetical protein